MSNVEMAVHISSDFNFQTNLNKIMNTSTKQSKKGEEQTDQVCL